MESNKEFYIGWKEKMPEKNKHFIKRIIISLLILLPLLAITVVFYQKNFNHHQFEFGRLSKITGTYFASPVPLLIADQGSLPDSISTDLLLVGYGKFGAEGIMKAIEEKNGKLSGKKVTMEGTLIYGDGKSLLELTAKEQSLLEVFNDPQRSVIPSPESRPITAKGEVLDPKCYFGVMKPGEGKIHRSCAIRCISGGIPPVLRTGETSGSFKYYLILDKEGNKVNSGILPFVAEQVSIEGKTSSLFGWDMLYVDLENIKIEKQ